MKNIHVLDKELANLIAAGEVVERPASVVKELVENSIDAGATSITVEIKNGGTSYIRITDNGHGMNKENASLAFLPHATSKISSADDLFNILSLGFRGEALSSIAAVSRVTLLTRTQDSNEGTHIEIEGGELLLSEETGTPVGTTMIVSDLFYNTPARQKFLKADGAEMASITDVCQKLALARPDISFTYISNLKEVFFTPGDGDLYNAIYAIYGKNIAQNLIKVSFEKNGIKIEGYAGNAQAARPNRNMQIFYVNKRVVVNKTMQAALMQSYNQILTVGKFATAILFLTMPPSVCDVNVHPAKTEVKFHNDHDVFDTIYWGVKNALFEKTFVPDFEFSKDKTNDEEALEKKPENIAAPTPVSTSSFAPVQKVSEPAFDDVIKASVKPAFTSEEKTPIKTGFVTPAPKYTPQTFIQKSFEEKAEQTAIKEELDTDFKIIGQAFSTYIIVQKNDMLYFIDQHAAHERLKYEALLQSRRNNAINSQTLLVPVEVSVSAKELSVYLENAKFFERLGFEIEEGFDRELLVRMIPTDVPDDEVKTLVLNILTLLEDSNKVSASDLEGEALYTVACKAALKAGRTMSVSEQTALIKDVFALDGINTCPHGRPIIIQMTKQKIEKEFKRI